MANTVTATAGPSRIAELDETEVLVIGGGIAGCALAYGLAQAGRKVAMIERDLSEPDRIVGELLQPGGVAALEALGMADTLEGLDATPVEGYCVISGARQVEIPYPRVGAETEAESESEAGSTSGSTSGSGSTWPVATASGKKEGRSFHHGRFVQSLRRKVAGSSAHVVEATVRDLLYCPHSRHVIGVKCTARGDAEEVKLYAPLTIIADGCFSKFRTAPGAALPAPELRSFFVGLVLRDVQLPLQNHGTVVLTPAGPVLLYQIGHGARETRMLVDVKPVGGKLPSVADGSLKRHIVDDFVPHLPAALQAGVRAALERDRLRSMPNSFLPPSMQGLASGLSGAVMVGDAWNMRHPLTGGGMTVALHDAVLLARALAPGAALPAGRAGLERWDVIAPRLQDWFWARKDLAGTVNVLSIALYDLFGGTDAGLDVLREGCFRYFARGGECVAGPVGLLSALRPEPFTLFRHFFKVAFFSIAVLFAHGRPGSTRRPGPAQWPALAAYSCQVFWTACVVFLPVMLSELRSNTHRAKKTLQ